MTIKQALYKAEDLLASRDIEDAHLEAEVLLMHALSIKRVKLYSELEKAISPEDSRKFEAMIQRRILHEPTHHIVGYREFYGLDFYTDHRALIPRPETETIVEEVLKFASQRFLAGTNFLIADIGTGSGVIAVTLSALLPQALVYATDISTDALEIARINCQKHNRGNQVKLLHGDMLQPIPEPVDLLVANLPYVIDTDIPNLSPEIRLFEPMEALAGGADGLDKIRKLLAQAPPKLRPNGLILLEMGFGQNMGALALAETHFPNAEIDLIQDLAGIDRVLRITT